MIDDDGQRTGERTRASSHNRLALSSSLAASRSSQADRSAEERRVAACGRVLCGLGRCKRPWAASSPRAWAAVSPRACGRCTAHPAGGCAEQGGCRGRVPRLKELRADYSVWTPEDEIKKAGGHGACKPDVCTDSVARVQRPEHASC
ncbi:unnamed protein product [Boreogadus saida]